MESLLEICTTCNQDIEYRFISISTLLLPTGSLMKEKERRKDILA
jgi:hypothetical protein